MDDAEDVVSFDEAVKDGERRIVFTGPRRYIDFYHELH